MSSAVTIAELAYMRIHDDERRLILFDVIQLSLLELTARRGGWWARQVDRAAGAAPFEGAAGRTSLVCIAGEWPEGAGSDPARPYRDQTRMPGAARVPAGNLLCGAEACAKRGQ